MEAAAECVGQQGVAVYGPVNLDWMPSRSYCFYDPDGDVLEVLALQSGA